MDTRDKFKGFGKFSICCAKFPPCKFACMRLFFFFRWHMATLSFMDLPAWTSSHFPPLNLQTELHRAFCLFIYFNWVHSLYWLRLQLPIWLKTTLCGFMHFGQKIDFGYFSCRGAEQRWEALLGLFENGAAAHLVKLAWMPGIAKKPPLKEDL